MRVLTFSDAHLTPHLGLPSAVREFFQTPADVHIANGDTLELVKYRPQEFVDSRCMRELYVAARGLDFRLIPGNHDPRPDLLRLVPPQWLAPDLLEIDGVLYTHGDMFGGWWQLLKPFGEWYPDFYRWLQQFRQTPGRYNPHNLQKFNRLALAVQGQALLYARNAGKPIVIGHSHLPAQYQAHGTVWMVDCGTPGYRLWAVATDGHLEQRRF